LFLLGWNTKFQGNGTRQFWNFIQEKGSFLDSTAALQTAQQKRQKVHFTAQLQEAPMSRDADREAEGLGRGNQPWLNRRHSGVPKSLWFRVPTGDPEAEPIPTRRFGPDGFALQLSVFKSLTAQSARGRRPVGTFWGLQGPSSIPGLGNLMYSRGK